MLKRFYIVAIVFVALGVIGFTSQHNFKEEGKATSEFTENTYNAIVVLELFTSQGCSSCPAADKLLEEVKKLHPEDVFTLSYHVDYWNYIGWKDPFSSSEYSKKQSVYNRKFQYNGNYTPEVVVNGKSHFTGSNRTKMNASISRFKKEKVVNKVVIAKSGLEKGKATFSYSVEGDLDDKNMRAILVLDERTTEVKRGENRNRTIKNSNIVVAEQSITLTDTKGTGEITVPKEVLATDTVNLILLVENSVHEITAAAKKTL